MDPSQRDHDLATRLCAVLRSALAARPTATHPDGLAAAGMQVERHLQALGFSVCRHSLGSAPDVLVAVRPGRGRAHIGLAGHYDVEEVGEGWTYPPFEITVARGRIYGRGVADNLGPLWLRLLALEDLQEATPTLTFVLQAEEEIGSPAAHEIYPALDLPSVDLWLEETGYFEIDGVQRLLVRRRGPRTEPWIAAALRVAGAHDRSVKEYDRYLNKAFGEQRCPFLAHLAGTATYLAIGPNDPESKIHSPDESLPISNLGVSVDQFCAVLSAAAQET